MDRESRNRTPRPITSRHVDDGGVGLDLESLRTWEPDCSRSEDFGGANALSWRPTSAAQERG